MKLRDYSIAYDKFLKIYEKNPKYQSKKDSVGILYKAQIRKIKGEPLRNEVLAFLNNATGKDSVLYSNDKGYNYKSYNQLLSVRIRELPTLLEYFKAVKYSLFEQNKEELLHMRDIPFLKYKATLSIERY